MPKVVVPDFIEKDTELKACNTFGLSARSMYFCRVSKEAELLSALEFSQTRQLPVLILGGGSNILLTKNFEGLTICLENRGITAFEFSGEQVKIRVAAGENWHELVLHCLRNSWFGLENLSLIPGSVGAAPMQNIGAYGVEAGKFIDSIRYYHTEYKCWMELSGGDCAFGYRDSIFKNDLKGKAIIWEVCFTLSLKPDVQLDYGDIRTVLEKQGILDASPEDVSRAVISIRQSKLPDPAVLGNAGSFFKNPVIGSQQYERLKQKWPDLPGFALSDGNIKVPAGWLIEKTGWKGLRKGACGVHEKQALVLVNFGAASGSELLSLAREIIADVQAESGILLVPEVNIL
jgi:UDP-N-acetylmuramate dehydrogenase